MKFNKKVLGIFFIALLAIVLVACGGTTTTGAPTTQAPTTQAPTTQAPTTQAPTTQAPTTDAPIDLLALIEQLRDQYADTLNDEDFIATEDLNLITSFMGVTVAWQSSNTTYLENDGTVHRPSYATGDQTVILTATLSYGDDSEDVMFFVTIAAQEKTDQERANEVFLIVTAFPAKEKWSEADNAALDFLTSGQDADGVSHTVVWTSSHPDVISVDGTITQSEDGDVVVTMTATITINSVDYTRDVVFTVAQKTYGTVVNTIAEAIALGEDAYVQILGVTVFAKHDSGDVFFTDGVDILYIYTPTFVSVIGGVYDISGVVDFYYNAPQLTGTSTNPLLAIPSEAPAQEAPFTAAASVLEIITNTTTPTSANPFVYAGYTVSAAIYYDSSWGNYSLFLVPVDYDFDAPLAAGAKQPNGDAIMMYYKSADEVLRAFHGQVVTIDIVMQGWRTDLSVWYANFFGTVEDVEVAFATDEEAVATALASLTYPGTITEDTTLTFPAELYGVTLEYVSDNAAIDVATGAVDAASQTEQVTVTITVTATKGIVVDTKVITILVGELPVSSVAQALAAPNATLLRVQGTVIAGAYYRTFFIQDNTGNIAVYIPNTAAMIAFLADNLGNVVEVVGTRGAYSGLNQIVVASIDDMSFVEEGTLPVPTNLDDLEINNDNFAPYQGQLIELTGMKVTAKAADSYGNVTMTLTNLRNGTTIPVRWDSRQALPAELGATLTAIAVDDIINITSVLAWFNGPQIYIVTTTEFAMTTDAEKLAADAATLPTTKETTSGATEMAPLVGPYGSTIVWDATEITTAGGTYDPVTGEVVYPTVTENTVYNVVGTVSLGEETDIVVNLAITVLALTDEEKVAAAMVDTSIDEETEGYQVVTLPLTGLYGTTISWTIISGEATLAVDGTTLTYHQIAEVGTVVLEATFENGTVTDTKQYTVTVTPVTIITDLSTIPAMANGTVIFVQGVVTGISYDGAFIQDANGAGFFLYQPGNKASLNIGDEVIYSGTVAEYQLAKQLASGGIFRELISTENALIYNSVTADEIDAFATADAGWLYTFDGFKLSSVSGSTMILEYTKLDESTGTVTIRYYTNWADLVLVAGNYSVGDTLPTVNFILYNFNYSAKQLDVVTVDFTDAEYIQWDADALPATLSLSNDYVVPTPANGSTYTVIDVSTELSAYIDYTTTPGTLLVTQPAIGEPDAVGTVTIQVTLGTEPAIDVVINVTVKAEVDPGALTEQVVYSTSFAVEEGFTTGTVYNNTTIKLDGPVEQQWGTYYGTVSTTSAITVSSMQMRYYTTAPVNIGYTYTNFDVTDMTKFTFFAKNESGINVEVSISVDGGTTWIEAQIITLTTTATEYTYNIPVAYQTGNVRIKFTMVLQETPAAGRLYIDDVKFYGMR